MKNKKLNIDSHGYKVPKDYFETLEDRVFNTLHSESNLPKDLSSGYKVPNGYFSNIEDSVFAKLRKEDIPTISLFNRKRLYTISSIAAALLICAALFFRSNTNTEISVDMVESYFETQDLDTYELARLLSEAELISEDFNLVETNYEEENLETYLLEHSDIEDIIE